MHTHTHTETQGSQLQDNSIILWYRLSSFTTHTHTIFNIDEIITNNEEQKHKEKYEIN